MVKDDRGVLVPAQKIEQIVHLFPRMKKIARLDSHFVADMDSSNITPDIWKELATIIYDRHSDYDGFVITHGTDTLAYTASALSLALGNLKKPVILTGAQKPISEFGSDSHFNLFNSVKVAASGCVREVAVVFDTKIMRGNRCSKQYAHKIDAFWSPQFQLLGEIGVDIKYYGKHPTGPKKLDLRANFQPDIVSLDIFPGFSPAILHRIVAEKLCRGIVLRGFGLGNIPIYQRPSLPSVIKEATSRQIPVVLISSCPGGTTRLGLYETGKKALKAGAISAKDMTLEAVTVKLMWALAQADTVAGVHKIMRADRAGEIGPIGSTNNPT